MSGKSPTKTREVTGLLNQAFFPEVVDGKINTTEFLDAARNIVRFVEKLGKIFAPVKYDMQGNIDKLNARYSNDKEVNATLQELILAEVANGADVIATDALMWLTRGLHMILLFLEEIVRDHKAGSATEDLVAILRNAYKEALEPYHGWVAQQLFGFLSRMAPTRTQILGMLANAETENEQIFPDLEVYLGKLRINITTIQKFYKDNNLEDNRVV